MSEPRVNFTTGMQNSQSVQPKVVSTPPPKDEGLKVTGSKYIFYCTHATMNCTDGLGHYARFRNHAFRTDDDKVVAMLNKDFIGREGVPFSIKLVTEEELQELLSAVDPGPAAVIEPIPDQGQDKPNPDLVSADGKEGVVVVTDEQLVAQDKAKETELEVPYAKEVPAEESKEESSYKPV